MGNKLSVNGKDPITMSDNVEPLCGVDIVVIDLTHFSSGFPSRELSSRLSDFPNF